MKKLPLLLLGGLLTFFAITPAFAGWWGGPGGRGGYGPGDCGGPCYTGDLDDRLDQSRQEFLEKSKDLRQQLFDKKSSYYDLLQQENPDKEEAAKLWSEIFDLQTELQKMAASAGFPTRGQRLPYRGYGPDNCTGPGCGYGPGNGYGPRGGQGRGCYGPGGRW